MAKRSRPFIHFSTATAPDSELLLTQPITVNLIFRQARLIVAALAAVLISAIPAIAQTSASSSAAVQSSAPQQATTAAVAIPSYPDSPAGLEKLINDMMKMQKDSDAKNLATYIQSLILPNPNAWFSATFGDQAGKEMAAAYDRTRLNLPLSFPDTLAQIQSKHLTKIAAALFTDSCDPEERASEYSLLVNRTHEQPLYHVRVSSGTQTGILGFFANVDGAFRYISNFQLKTPPILRVGEDVMGKKLISGPNPPYPEHASQSHISGTVVLHAIIGTDGRVCGLEVVSGPLELRSTSFNTVRQWRYMPTTLNGKPVPVDTMVSIVFDISN